jgi:hypothetical protein
MIFASTRIVEPANAAEELELQSQGDLEQITQIRSQQPVIQPEPVPIDEPIPGTPQPQVPLRPEPTVEIEEERKTISEIWEGAFIEMQGSSIPAWIPIWLCALYYSGRLLPGLIISGIRTLPSIALLVIRLISTIPKLISFICHIPQYFKEFVLLLRQLLPLIQDLFSLM